MEEIIKRIKGMFKVCTDNIKTDHNDIIQEKIDNSYNNALTDVLSLLTKESDCKHEWKNIPEYDLKKGKWSFCKKCPTFKKGWNEITNNLTP